MSVSEVTAGSRTPVGIVRRRGGWVLAAERTLLSVFIVVPFLALAAGIWLGLRWDAFSWHDAVLTGAFYAAATAGVTVGYHRYFTHGGFKTGRGLRRALAAMGSMAAQGGVITWVSDHRRHHAYADADGDPHSPWRFGPTLAGLVRGLAFAHIGWFFTHETTDKARYTPDLLADPDLVWFERWWLAFATGGVALPALIGGLWSGTWRGAITALLWAGLVRIGLLHHVTWSINSICHVAGTRPFRGRDKSTNFWPLALLSFGESWHNLHHVEPTSARHGVLRGQLDISAGIIRSLERVRLVWDVRWPKPDRLVARGVAPAGIRRRWRHLPTFASA